MDQDNTRAPTRSSIVNGVRAKIDKAPLNWR